MLRAGVELHLEVGATGYVVRKIYKRSVTKMRQKLKKLNRKLIAGRMTFADIWTTWQSWRSYARRFDAWHTIQNMGKLFDQLFVQGWLSPT